MKHLKLYEDFIFEDEQLSITGDIVFSGELYDVYEIKDESDYRKYFGETYMSSITKIYSDKGYYGVINYPNKSPFDYKAYALIPTFNDPEKDGRIYMSFDGNQFIKSDGSVINPYSFFKFPKNLQLKEFFEKHYKKGSFRVLHPEFEYELLYDEMGVLHLNNPMASGWVSSEFNFIKHKNGQTYCIFQDISDFEDLIGSKTDYATKQYIQTYNSEEEEETSYELFYYHEYDFKDININGYVESKHEIYSRLKEDLVGLKNDSDKEYPDDDPEEIENVDERIQDMIDSEKIDLEDYYDLFLAFDDNFIIEAFRNSTVYSVRYVNQIENIKRIREAILNFFGSKLEELVDVEDVKKDLIANWNNKTYALATKAFPVYEKDPYAIVENRLSSMYNNYKYNYGYNEPSKTFVSSGDFMDIFTYTDQDVDYQSDDDDYSEGLSLIFDDREYPHTNIDVDLFLSYLRDFI